MKIDWTAILKLILGSVFDFLKPKIDTLATEQGKKLMDIAKKVTFDVQQIPGLDNLAKKAEAFARAQIEVAVQGIKDFKEHQINGLLEDAVAWWKSRDWKPDTSVKPVPHIEDMKPAD